MEVPEVTKEDALSLIRKTLAEHEGIAPIIQSNNIPQDNDDEFDIEGSIKEAAGMRLLSKESKLKARKEIVKEKRMENYYEKKSEGIRPGKQSSYPTRGDAYLNSNLKALHIVMHNQCEIYKHGADVCHRMVVGAPHYGKPCVKNAFQLLMDVQDKLREKIGNSQKDYPKWIIISSGSSTIEDKDLLSRLDDLKDTTHCVGPFGFESIKPNGRFFEPIPEHTRGYYAQGDINSISWDFVIGNGFKNSDKYRIVCVYGPFIAIRGSTFMSMDFSLMAEKCESGFQHFMVDISLECLKRGHVIGTIKTMSKQYDHIRNYIDTPEFKTDQAFFYEKWKSFFPVSLKGHGR